jgi:hypothetical protein
MPLLKQWQLKKVLAVCEKKREAASASESDPAEVGRQARIARLARMTRDEIATEMITMFESINDLHRYVSLQQQLNIQLLQQNGQMSRHVTELSAEVLQLTHDLTVLNNHVHAVVSHAHNRVRDLEGRLPPAPEEDLFAP